MKNKTKKIAYGGMLIAIALILSYIERFIILPVPVPGIKLGLANLAVLISLYLFGPSFALFVSVARILLAALMFSGFSGFFFSIAGGLLSLFFMWLTYDKKFFSLPSVSVLGGVAHNSGQILVASLVVSNPLLLYYIIPLAVAGAVTGFINGLLALSVLKVVKK